MFGEHEPFIASIIHLFYRLLSEGFQKFLPFPWSFLFLSLFPVSSDLSYIGFVDLLPSLSIWKDNGILEEIV